MINLRLCVCLLCFWACQTKNNSIQSESPTEQITQKVELKEPIFIVRGDSGLGLVFGIAPDAVERLLAQRMAENPRFGESLEDSRIPSPPRVSEPPTPITSERTTDSPTPVARTSDSPTPAASISPARASPPPTSLGLGYTVIHNLEDLTFPRGYTAATVAIPKRVALTEGYHFVQGSYFIHGMVGFKLKYSDTAVGEEYFIVEARQLAAPSKYSATGRLESKTLPCCVTPGDITDQYRIGEQLGAGGEGVVYRAVEVASQQTFAIKQSKAPPRLEMLRAIADASQDSPHLAQLHSAAFHVDPQDGVSKQLGTVTVMELLDGDLDQLPETEIEELQARVLVQGKTAMQKVEERLSSDRELDGGDALKSKNMGYKTITDESFRGQRLKDMNYFIYKVKDNKGLEHTYGVVA